jgi:hypothetical protein
MGNRKFTGESRNCLTTRLQPPQKVFINHMLSTDMIHTSFLIVFLVLGIWTSLLTFSSTLSLSGHHLLLNEALGSQDFGSQDAESEDQQMPNGGISPDQCPPNQHIVGSTNECEWDNCGLATPPMYRNTQTGRCVSDCSEVGQVNQGNVCVPGVVGETTPIQSPLSNESASNQGDDNRNVTIITEDIDEVSAENTTMVSPASNITSTPSTLAPTVAGNATMEGPASNITSTPSTLAPTVTSLAGEPQVPYACFSNTFTCYCDGTEDCKGLASSGECDAEVRSVEGEPGLGECDWNAKS